VPDEIEIRKAIDHIVTQCGSLRQGERAMVVADESTGEIARLVARGCTELGAHVSVHTIPMASMHGAEPPSDVAEEMKSADLIFGLTRYSMAHSRARNQACHAGARYLSLPEYSHELLRDPAVLADYRGRAPVVRAFADAFTRGRRVRVTTELGTDISLDITGRKGNYCPGFVEGPGELGSPPDIEANVSPVETGSNGVVIIDGSIPCAEVGLLQSPVELTIRDGRIVRFDSEDGNVVGELERLFEGVGSDKAYVLAECGVGLNEAARLTGVMLTDEGASGCMHFGFGSNSTVGGQNEVSFHLDFVFRSPDLFVDERQMLVKGAICP
jgi:leucyl aminopeptidase (aminopeptidase T)